MTGEGSASALNRALAHAVLRFTLGINIGLHGVQRFPHLAMFARGVIKQFDGLLPSAIVTPYAFTLPFVEAGIGLLLIIGLWERGTLVAGGLYMASLTFGTALRGEHDVLAEQLGYELLYFILLATLGWSRFSLDTVIAGRRPSRQPQARTETESAVRR